MVCAALISCEGSEEFDGSIADGAVALGEVCGSGSDEDLDGLIDCDDPDCQAPPIPGGAFADDIGFLWRGGAGTCAGGAPQQTGVAPGELDDTFVAAVFGRVIARDGAPIAGATVTVLGQPAWGRVRTDARGEFMMAVRAGTRTLDVSAPGYLPSQRTISIAAESWESAGDFVIIPRDAASTSIALRADAPQVHRANEVVDESGSRTPTLIFPPGVRARMTLPDGTVRDLTSLTVRATEYTVGPRGPDSMPGTLPSLSGYTHAVELDADEAVDAAATRVDLSASGEIYYVLENFLHFPVGTGVPLGSYDRELGRWVSDGDGGVVARVLTISAGEATLDTDGDGAPDDFGHRALREAIARTYSPGAELWLTPIDHFTPFDCNWPFLLAGYARAVNIATLRERRRCRRFGSLIECGSQTLMEAIPLAGLGTGLVYRSDRVKGRTAAWRIELRAAEPPPEETRLVRIEIDVAGRRHIARVSPTPTWIYVFDWDGTDRFGRNVDGTVNARVRIGYDFDGVYRAPGSSPSAPGGFGIPGGDALLTADRTRQMLTLWRGEEMRLGVIDAREEGLGGWNLPFVHRLDATGERVLLGSGEELDLRDAERMAFPFAGRGDGSSATSGDEGPATEASFGVITSIYAANDGRVFLADATNSVIRVVNEYGRITTFAGTGTRGVPIAGVAATSTPLFEPTAMTMDDAGALYVVNRGSDFPASCIIRITPSGMVEHAIGRCTESPAQFDSRDIIPAREVAIPTIVGITWGDGSLYFAESNIPSGLIWRLRDDGNVERYAGRRTELAGRTERLLARIVPSAITWSERHRMVLFIDDERRVRGVDRGTIVDILGSNTLGSDGDGLRAGDASFLYLDGLASDPSGRVCVADVDRPQRTMRVRCLEPNGRVVRAAGRAVGATEEAELGRATDLPLTGNRGALAMRRDGTIFTANSVREGDVSAGSTVFRVPPVLGTSADGLTLIASENGANVWAFDAAGRHTRTVDGVTGDVIFTIERDDRGQVVRIEDPFGRASVVERAAGTITLRDPYDHVATLHTSPEGWLEDATDASGARFDVVMDAGGLLENLVEPTGASHRYGWDAQGRLTEDEQPSGTIIRLARQPDGSVRVIDGRGVVTTHGTVASADGATSTTFEDGLSVTEVVDPFARTTRAVLPDRTESSITTAADPRYGWAAPYRQSVTLRTPSGRMGTWFFERSVDPPWASDPADIEGYAERVFADPTADPFGAAWQTVWVSARRQFVTLTPSGLRSTVTLEEHGLPSLIEPPGVLPTSIVYDGNGRAVTVTQGARTVTMTYSTDGALETVTDATGRVTRITRRDAATRWLRAEVPGPRAIESTRDVLGRITSATGDGDPARFTIDYTLSGAVDRVSVPGAAEARFTYDAESFPATLSSPAGTVEWHRDAIGRADRVHLSRGDFQLHRDALGRVVRASGPDGASYGVDYDGPIATGYHIRGPATADVTVEYDALLRASRVSVGGEPIELAFDQDMLLAGMGDVSLTRDPITGRFSSTEIDGVRCTVTHDGYGMEESRRCVRGATLLFDEQLTRDGLGRVATSAMRLMAEPVRTSSVAFAEDGRLESIAVGGTEVEHYRQHPNGGWLEVTRAGTTSTATRDASGRLTALGSARFGYDDAGRRTSRVEGGLTTTYSHDEVGTLLAVDLPDGREIRYRTDPMGRRADRAVDGTVTDRWVYLDGELPIARVADDGDAEQLYFFAAGTLAGIRDGAGETYAVASDRLGSVRLIVRTRDGAVMQRLDYDAFGRVTRDTNPGFQPFGYACGLYDAATGLVRFGAREYDAETGQWLTPDPAGLAGGLNAYEYAAGDPIDLVDHTGELPILALPAIGGAAGGVFTVGVQLWNGTRVSCIHAGDVAWGIRTGAGLGFAFEAGLGLLGLGGRSASLTGLANPVPGRMARVIPAEFVSGTRLGAPNASEVWVTAADDLAGIETSEGLASRLTLVDSSGNLIPGPRAVIEFDTVSEGLASPVLRDAPGFVGGGRTAGGAREFILPNLSIDGLENVSIRIVP